MKARWWVSRWFLAAAVGILVLDQVTKILASEVTYNSGVSFGFLTALPSVVTVPALLVVLIGVLVFGVNLWQQYPGIAGVLVGGACSNLIDRLAFGGVRDWLTVPGLPLRNNLADWAIAVSVVFFLVLELKNTRKDHAAS